MVILLQSIFLNILVRTKSLYLEIPSVIVKGIIRKSSFLVNFNVTIKSSIIVFKLCGVISFRRKKYSRSHPKLAVIPIDSSLWTMRRLKIDFSLSLDIPVSISIVAKYIFSHSKLGIIPSETSAFFLTSTG